MGNWHSTFDHKFDTFQFMVWHKTNPVPKIYKAGFLNSCELIVCIWNKGHTWNFISQKEMHNFIETPICMGRERLKEPVHPTQKPVRVLKHIIKIASNPGDLVLDPFMGVGSTGIAALEMDRRFLGIEIDEKYFNAAEKRLKAVVPNLFDIQKVVAVSDKAVPYKVRNKVKSKKSV
jgi:site-specific DNA-methyltransferase (adenine-specific)/modification methylase